MTFKYPQILVLSPCTFLVHATPIPSVLIPTSQVHRYNLVYFPFSYRSMHLLLSTPCYIASLSLAFIMIIGYLLDDVHVEASIDHVCLSLWVFITASTYLSNFIFVCSHLLTAVKLYLYIPQATSPERLLCLSHKHFTVFAVISITESHVSRLKRVCELD